MSPKERVRLKTHDSKLKTAFGDWGARAARVYDSGRADRYRAHDDVLPASRPSMELAGWLTSICETSGRDLSVLDIGCGTGRYFWALKGVRELVGLDASAAMLEHARKPYASDKIQIESLILVEGDVFRTSFEPARFDVIYSIGVLAELSPLDQALVDRVTGWLKVGGRFAFTAVRPDSPSMPKTLRRRLALWMARWAPNPLAAVLRRRLMSGGLYADEQAIHDLLTPSYVIESLTNFQSEAHLHCLCVARKRPAA